MTYGQVRLRLTKLLPGVDQELLDGWMYDRYRQILDRLKWQRLDVQSVIQTVAPYSTGTVTLNTGSTTVTGVGTNWTSGIVTGCGLWIPGRREFYELTYVSGSQATLDRPYEGNTVIGSAYKIYQSVYTLPADCKILKSVRSLETGPIGPWNSHLQTGAWFGPPASWRPLMDTTTGRQQIELYPVPDKAYGIAIEYTAEQTNYDGSDATVTALPWIREGCIVNGVLADANLAAKDFNASDRYEAKFEKDLADMRRTEILRTPPKPIRLAPELNAANWRRPVSNHPARLRMPGVWDDQG